MTISVGTAPSMAPTGPTRQPTFAPTRQPTQPTFAPTRRPSATRSSIQDEGNACFDMAASMPGLQSITGKYYILINTHCSDSMT